jgi:membrane protease YdiL (CAAX protease family)
MIMVPNEMTVWSAPLVRVREYIFPPPRNRSVPWGAAELFVVLMGFGLAIPAAILILARKLFHVAEHDARFTLGLVLASGTLTIIGAPMVMRMMCGARLYQMGLHGDRLLRNVLLGVGTYFFVIPLVAGIMALSLRAFRPTPHEIEKIIRHSPTLGYFVAASLCAVVIAPLQEELLFRGILLPWLRRKLAARPAIALSALIFSALHSDAWPAPIPLFVLALFLGYLAHHTNSLVAPIALHATFNAISMLILMLVVDAPTDTPTSASAAETLTHIFTATSIFRGP